MPQYNRDVHTPVTLQHSCLPVFGQKYCYISILKEKIQGTHILFYNKNVLFIDMFIDS